MAEKKYLRLKHFEVEVSNVLFLGQAPYLDLGSPFNASDPLQKKVLLNEGVMIEVRPVEKGQSSKESFLIIEPHPDDFALSCSGFALSKLQEGASLSLLNLFSGSSLSTFPWNQKVQITEEEYEALRLYESRTAAEYLDIPFKSYKLPLGLKRGHRTPFEKLREKDWNTVDRLAGNLTMELKDGFSAVVAPCGIQDHVDHVVALEAVRFMKIVRQEAGSSLSLFLYEDMPYAENRVAYQKRMRELNQRFHLKPVYIPVGEHLEIMADLASVYRSQFDDVTRAQRLALMQDHARTVAAEARSEGVKFQDEFAQRIFE